MGHQIGKDLMVKGKAMELIPKKINSKSDFRAVIKKINTASNSPLDANFIKNASIDALMMSIMSERAEVLEGVLREQVDEIRKKNSKLKEARNILGKARADKSGATDKEKTQASPEILKFMAKENISFNKDYSKEFSSIKKYTQKYKELEKKGASPEQLAVIDKKINKKISSMNVKLSDKEWDITIENIKGWTESLTSTSQLDMTQLQSTSGKFNQTFEMLSQFTAKYFRTGDKIIGNI